MTIVLTDREAHVMQVLWERGPSVAANVRRRLPDKPAYTTVFTVLTVLESKGYVGHEEEGRVHHYFAAVQQNATQKRALSHVTSKLFKGSVEFLFAHLVSDKKLTAEQVRRMRKVSRCDSRGHHDPALGGQLAGSEYRAPGDGAQLGSDPALCVGKLRANASR
jgi:predicted transcriptional regulator